VNALANEEVGKYLNNNFVSSYQKVGTFKIVNGQKQGGNVASYFCLSDGSVLHVVPGPVDAATLLREARWVVDTRKLAITASQGDPEKYKAMFRKAHADRLKQEHRVDIDSETKRGDFTLASFDGKAADKRGKKRGLGTLGQAHLLLAENPLVKLDQVYPVVFEKILGEKISTLPVVKK
jgi:hypothetical protein